MNGMPRRRAACRWSNSAIGVPPRRRVDSLPVGLAPVLNAATPGAPDERPTVLHNVKCADILLWSGGLWPVRPHERMRLQRSSNLTSISEANSVLLPWRRLIGSSLLMSMYALADLCTSSSGSDVGVQHVPQRPLEDHMIDWIQRLLVTFCEVSSACTRHSGTLSN